jgi:hypothetical protein
VGTGGLPGLASKVEKKDDICRYFISNNKNAYFYPKRISWNLDQINHIDK